MKEGLHGPLHRDRLSPTPNMGLLWASADIYLIQILTCSTVQSQLCCSMKYQVCSKKYHETKMASAKTSAHIPSQTPSTLDRTLVRHGKARGTEMGTEPEPPLPPYRTYTIHTYTYTTCATGPHRRETKTLVSGTNEAGGWVAEMVAYYIYGSRILQYSSRCCCCCVPLRAPYPGRFQDQGIMVGSFSRKQFPSADSN